MTSDSGQAAILEAVKVSKWFGGIIALNDVSLAVMPGEVTCVLGDNRAGKSTLIKILSGALTPDRGSVLVSGSEVTLRKPKHAMRYGIATVYQDLALIPIMPIYRNFCLGAEYTKGRGVFRRFDKRRAWQEARKQLEELGINITDVGRPVSTLSGGQRQVTAIASAVHFGAKVLILDEPTAALGRGQAGIVLDYIRRSRDRGVGIVLISHNVQHAFSVGDSFTILDRGSCRRTFAKAGLSLSELADYMAGVSNVEGSLTLADIENDTSTRRTE